MVDGILSKIFEMPVVEFYTNGAFLSNICYCLYGNKTAIFWSVQLMLDDYLDLIVEETSDETETTSDDDDVSM